VGQSLSRIHIHAIFSTKSREPVLHESWRDELFRVLGGAANNCGCQSLLVGGVADHVHILFELSRTLTVASAMEKIKSPSSAWVNQSRVLSTHFAWQNGYAAFSVSHSNLDAVRMYIQRQEEHHQRQSYQDELREFFTKHHIEWDERYVWE
jgi:REP element-mobilizing transposase RayT